jgi:pimeloyl-ACP methyl ester carboxylesterase
MVGLQADNLFANFKDMDIPCLLVYGDKDQAIKLPSDEISKTTFTHQVVLDESGHFPMVDETTKFNRLLTDFLALDSGASPSELQMKDEWRRRVR